MLLIASYIFYMSWIPQFILLIVPMTFLNWVWGAFMHRHMEKRKLLLGIGIGLNLLTLGIFKYAGFAVGTAAAAVGLVTHHNPGW